MKYTTKTEKAIQVAATLHRHQLRKSEREIPYIVHPFTVALYLSHYTDDEDTIVAALLHDTIEDTDYSPDDLERDFGSNVREIVMGVTEQKDDESGNKRSWRDRKEDYIKNLADDSRESMLLSAADKICNMRDMVAGYREYGSKYLANFGASAEERNWYHEEVYKVLKQKLDSPILRDYEELLKETKTIK